MRTSRDGSLQETVRFADGLRWGVDVCQQRFQRLDPWTLETLDSNTPSTLRLKATGTTNPDGAASAVTDFIHDDPH